MIIIDERLSINDDELTFVASHSSGPGGQNVNKVSTRVTLRFDVANSPSLSPEQKELLFSGLASRINKDGILSVTVQRFRTQGANREAAIARFGELLRAALRPRPVRRKTKIPRAAKRQRLEEKRQHSRLKQERVFKPTGEEE